MYVDAKRETVRPPSDDEREDREDELPTVVVLKSGDVTQEEFMEFRKIAKEGESLLGYAMPCYEHVQFKNW